MNAHSKSFNYAVQFVIIHNTDIISLRFCKSIEYVNNSKSMSLELK